jgi:hypothetical protein
MSSPLLGHWAVQMRTPVGSIAAAMTFDETVDGFAGSAAGKSETVPLRNIRIEASGDTHHVTWQQSITKPLRLNLEFDVTIEDDEMFGHSRAGRLPKSTVIGARIRDVGVTP